MMDRDRSDVWKWYRYEVMYKDMVGRGRLYWLILDTLHDAVFR